MLCSISSKLVQNTSSKYPQLASTVLILNNKSKQTLSTSAQPLNVNRSPKNKSPKLVEYIRKSPNELNNKNAKPIQMDYVNKAEIKFYDPPYLVREAPFPNYELLNISIKGYDYTTLDSYFKYIEKLCNLLDVEVVEAYAMPARNYKIKTYQPFSTNLDKEYSLYQYQRIVRVKNLKSTLAPLLFETVHLNLPEGVQMNVNVPSFEEDEFRYVPDLELQEMRQRLDEMTKKPKGEENAKTPAKK